MVIPVWQELLQPPMPRGRSYLCSLLFDYKFVLKTTFRQPEQLTFDLDLSSIRNGDDAFKRPHHCWGGGHIGSRHVKTLFSDFIRNESGATAIEYGLIAALISVGIITAATRLGSNVSNTFTKVAAKMS
jgi:pilus assembly protein Flp/PilA